MWGAPRVHGELLMLGFEVGEATVALALHAASAKSHHRRAGVTGAVLVRTAQSLGSRGAISRARQPELLVFQVVSSAPPPRCAELALLVVSILT